MSIAVVTGGAGFVGSHLCEYLLERDWRVLCLDNLDTGTLENIEGLRGDNFEFRYHNCVDHISVDGPVDAVFHLASPASPVDYLRLPLATLKVGSYGTHNALGLAKFKRARFLLTSTSEVYGDPEMHPQREEYWGNVNPVGPRGVYDEAKRYAEALTMAYHRQQGVDTHIARIFNTYGPRMRQNDGRAIPTFLRQAMERKPLTVFGDGSQTRSFCYVDDLVEGLFRLTTSDEHMPVNIGNPNEMTLLEMAEKCIAMTGTTSEIVFEGLPVDDPKVRQPDIAKAIRVLGWEPTDRPRRGPAAHHREPGPHPRHALRPSSASTTIARPLSSTTGSPPAITASCSPSSAVCSPALTSTSPSSTITASCAPPAGVIRSIPSSCRTDTSAEALPRTVMTLRSRVGPSGTVAEVSASPSKANGT